MLPNGGIVVAFPLIEYVSVQGYPLYPGYTSDHDLQLSLGPGPWIVLGVNGLGKSTLLLLMRYLLTGAVRTRSAGFAGERDDLQAVANRFFAMRVSGGADIAAGTIRVRIGRATLTVQRSLGNLSLNIAKVDEDQTKREIVDEAEYRNALIALMGVAQFADVVRILDNLSFFLEVRQPLIWDVAAQFELFRALATPNLSADLRRFEGEIVSADSAARNLNATLFKITQRRDREVSKTINADDTRARIASAQGEIDALGKEELALTDELESAENQKSDLNLQRKRGEQAVDDAAQAYEKLKFETLRQAFAGVKPTEQYLFLKLLSDRICIACNQAAPETADELQRRHDHGECVVCGNPRNFDENVEDISDAMRTKTAEAFSLLEMRRNELAVFHQNYSVSTERVAGFLDRLSAVRLASEDRQGQIRRLRKNLPTEEGLALSREEERIRTLRGEVLTFRKERETAERAIEELLNQLKRAVETIRERLEDAFDRRAAPFFAERVRLVYSPRSTKIGQGGRSFEFPSFEVEMTSGATLGQFVRRTPDQVSLSQREYLDIIFRMVLIEVLGDGIGTLVIDGPEGSLDAVFAGRAGDLFASFSDGNHTNVVLACNIVEGGFIPHTLARFDTPARPSRVVNLLQQALPTQALIELRPLYQQKVSEILLRDPQT